MAGTSEMKARFEAVRDGFREIIRDIAIDTHEELEDANRRQLYAGKRPDGTDITPEYRPLTQFLKQQKGQPWDRVTLSDTGDFWREIELRVDTEQFTMEDPDYKTPALLGKYGDVLGVSKSNLDTYRADTLRPKTKEVIQQRTGTGA